MQEGFTNVVTPICEKCKKYVYGGGFKMKGDKRVRWCVKCKPPGAVNGRANRDKIDNEATT
jgi:hypothetical protein